MGRNKDDSIRKLTKIGKSSYAVTLPMDVIRAFGWRAKQKLQIKISKYSKKITITDWEK